MHPELQTHLRVLVLFIIVSLGVEAQPQMQIQERKLDVIPDSATKSAQSCLNGISRHHNETVRIAVRN